MTDDYYVLKNWYKLFSGYEGHGFSEKVHEINLQNVMLQICATFWIHV